MPTWRTLVGAMVLLTVVVCMAQEKDVQIKQRPIRPVFFEKSDDVGEYVTNLKAYYKSGMGNRFGKRSSQYVEKSRQPIRLQFWRSPSNDDVIPNTNSLAAKNHRNKKRPSEQRKKQLQQDWETFYNFDDDSYESM